ncbi:MAG: hypothetical protein ACI9P8_001176 [Bacteroidia bacterium]|jgi:hypothetical protein
MSLRRKRNKIIGMATLAVAISFSIQAQVPGCMDTLALNFNSLAEINDGSCQYNPQSVYAITVADPMSSVVTESSGLLYHDESLWTINDSGNETELYQLDPNNGSVLKTVIIDNSTNVDWEALASDGVHFYIGDFGNNQGSRTDLGVYKVPWEPVLQSTGDTIVEAEHISYSYPDQVDFTPLFHQTDFDCEAMVFHNDSLHLFSKNWVDNKTRLYRVPAVSGTYEATLIDSFNVEGLVTDASIRPTDDVVMLLGYSEQLQPFMYLLNDFPSGNPLSGNKRRLNLPEHSFQQTEGVAFDDSLSVFFTREFSLSGPGLYHTDVTTILHPNGIESYNEEAIVIRRIDGRINIRWHAKMKTEGRVGISDLTGKVLALESVSKGTEHIEIRDPALNQILVIKIEEVASWSRGVVAAKAATQ